APLAAAGPSSWAARGRAIAAARSKDFKIFMLLRRLLHATLGRARGARDGSDDGPVVLVHDDRLLRLRPELARNVVVAVAEDARLDGQIAHALAEALLAANGAALHDHAGRLAHALVDAD